MVTQQSFVCTNYIGNNVYSHRGNSTNRNEGMTFKSQDMCSQSNVKMVYDHIYKVTTIFVMTSAGNISLSKRKNCSKYYLITHTCLTVLSGTREKDDQQDVKEIENVKSAKYGP